MNKLSLGLFFTILSTSISALGSPHCECIGPGAFPGFSLFCNGALIHQFYFGDETTRAYEACENARSVIDELTNLRICRSNEVSR